MLRLRGVLEIVRNEGEKSEGVFTIIGEEGGETSKIRAEFNFLVESFGRPNFRIVLEKKKGNSVRLIISAEEQAQGINIVVSSLFMMAFCYSRGVSVPQPSGDSFSGKFITPALSLIQAEELVQVLS